MEPDSHRLDREALLADPRAAKARVWQGIDAELAAAAAQRRAYLVREVDEIHAGAAAQREKERILAAAMRDAWASSMAAIATGHPVKSVAVRAGRAESEPRPLSGTG